MKKIKYTGRSPEYLEGFPKDCERSKEGAIHLLPGAIRCVSDGEWDHISKAYAKLPIRLIPEDRPRVRMLAQPKVKAAPAPAMAEDKARRGKKKK